MKTFKVVIELGNAAMETPEDVAAALRRIANTLDAEGRFYSCRQPAPIDFLESLDLLSIYDQPAGCYCSGCLKPCKPVWYDSKDSWVPECHTQHELRSHPSSGDEAEIWEITPHADASDITAYLDAMKDIRDTAKQSS